MLFSSGWARRYRGVPGLQYAGGVGGAEAGLAVRPVQQVHRHPPGYGQAHRGGSYRNRDVYILMTYYQDSRKFFLQPTYIKELNILRQGFESRR